MTERSAMLRGYDAPQPETIDEDGAYVDADGAYVDADAWGAENRYDPEDLPLWDSGCIQASDCPHGGKIGTERLVRGADGRWVGHTGLLRIRDLSHPDWTGFAHRECADAALGLGGWERLDFRVEEV
ncbi:hypothetical protein E1091_10580 [Micromonospora fluostatini]|uniref:Uncharacterized protein n=1 Tax=Micromonospora fluostatini TaxID=1629071 RepID=A0ABY2DGP4_9ACTN|nr:hypothetical protein E1091_10580 [Micromonospora fluostatini]